MLVEEIAAHVLTISVKNRVSLRLAAAEFFSKHPEYEKVKPAVRVVTTEVARRFKLLDRAAELVLGISPVRLDEYRRNLVRVVVFELMYRDFPLERFDWFCRRFNLTRTQLQKLREVSESDLLKGLSYIDKLCVKYSLPRWVIDEFIRAKIPDLEKMLDCFMRDPPRYLRVSTHLITRDELIERLKRYDIECIPDKDFDDLVRIVRAETHPAKTEEYTRGLYHIQDKSSVLVGHAVLNDLRKIGKVAFIDITGGPGGKITHVAQYGYYTVGVDLALRRVKEIERHVKRMQITLTDYLCADSTKIPIRLEKFRIILVDPECTGLGRLHHNPEAKMWLSIRDLRKHSKLQYLLLREAVRRAPKGAIIYYCTCTLTIEENEEQVKRIMEEFDVELVDIEPFIGCKSPFLDHVQRLYPHVNDATGFFIAKLVKK